MADILYHTEEDLVNDPTVIVKPKQPPNTVYNPTKYVATPVHNKRSLINNFTSSTNSNSDNVQHNDANNSIQYHTASDIIDTPIQHKYNLFTTPQSQYKYTANKSNLVQQLRTQYNIPNNHKQYNEHKYNSNDDIIDLTDDTQDTPMHYNNERKRKHTTPLLDTENSIDTVEYNDSDDEKQNAADIEQQQRIAEYKRIYNIVDIDTIKQQSQVRQDTVDYVVQQSNKQHEIYLHEQQLIQQQIDTVTRQSKQSTFLDLKGFDDILTEIEQQQRYDTIIPEHELIYKDMLQELISETVLRAHKTLPLTDTQLDLAATLIKRTPNTELICELNGIEVRGSDMKCLAGLAWLNDEVINCYLKLLQQRCDTTKQYRVWFYNTFFYAKLAANDTYNYNAVRRWSKTQKVDILNLDMLFVPVHVHGNHWTLVRLNFITKTAEYYDSLHGHVDNILKFICQYVQDEAKTYKNNPNYDMSDWSYISIHTTRQSNGSDCGVFTLMFAFYLCCNISMIQPYAFNATNMPYFRQRIALEIKYKQIV